MLQCGKSIGEARAQLALCGEGFLKWFFGCGDLVGLFGDLCETPEAFGNFIISTGQVTSSVVVLFKNWVLHGLRWCLSFIGVLLSEA